MSLIACPEWVAYPHAPVHHHHHALIVHHHSPLAPSEWCSGGPPLGGGEGWTEGWGYQPYVLAAGVVPVIPESPTWIMLIAGAVMLMMVGKLKRSRCD